jgi:hypothetical protein
MHKLYQSMHTGKLYTPFAGGDPGALLMLPADKQQVAKEQLLTCTKSKRLTP